jgi:membrane protease YdiL (CAAX protease family)
MFLECGCRNRVWAHGDTEGAKHLMRTRFDFATIASRPLWLELPVAVLLLAAALGWEYWRHVGLWQALRWSFWCVPWSVLAALPSAMMIGLLESPLRQRVRWLQEFREHLTASFAAFLGTLRWPEMVILSGLAGLSEEVFFRGILQQEIGAVLASLVFGMLHAISLPYMVWATLMGGYLGWLLHVTQTLWVPILTHTIVDIVGLCYIRRIAPPGHAVD